MVLLFEKGPRGVLVKGVCKPTAGKNYRKVHPDDGCAFFRETGISFFEMPSSNNPAQLAEGRRPVARETGISFFEMPVSSSSIPLQAGNNPAQLAEGRRPVAHYFEPKGA